MWVRLALLPPSRSRPERADAAAGDAAGELPGEGRVGAAGLVRDRRPGLGGLLRERRRDGQAVPAPAEEPGRAPAPLAHGHGAHRPAQRVSSGTASMRTIPETANATIFGYSVILGLLIFERSVWEDSSIF